MKQVEKGEHWRSTDMCESYSSSNAFLLLLFASYTWYEVRQCVCLTVALGVLIMYVVIRSPAAAVHQRHTYTL